MDNRTELVKHLRKTYRKMFNGLYITGFTRNKNFVDIVIISKSSMEDMEHNINYIYDGIKVDGDDKRWAEFNINCNGEIIKMLLYTYDNKDLKIDMINYYKKYT